MKVDGESNTRVPVEMLDLVRFACSVWAEVDNWAYENFDDNSIVNYPIVQGTVTQVKLRRIGKQPFNAEGVKKGLDWMQQFNRGGACEEGGDE